MTRAVPEYTRALMGYLLLTVRDYICLLWVVCVGLVLANVCKKQTIKCIEHSWVIFWYLVGCLEGGDPMFCCIHSYCASQHTQPSCIGYSGCWRYGAKTEGLIQLFALLWSVSTFVGIVTPGLRGPVCEVPSLH